MLIKKCNKLYMKINTIETKERIFQNTIAVLGGMVDLIIDTLSDTYHFDGSNYPKIILDTLAPVLVRINTISYELENTDDKSYTELKALYTIRQELAEGVINELSRFI